VDRCPEESGGIVRKSGEVEDSCREKIGYFLQRGLSYRADIDLNAWYILALNRRPASPLSILYSVMAVSGPSR